MKKLTILLLLLIISCNSSEEKQAQIPENNTVDVVKTPTLYLVEANRLAQLPLHCMDTEYPNKLNQTIGSTSVK